MYLVVSYWEPIPGHELEFKKVGRAMRDVLAAQAGVEFLEAFSTGSGKEVVVHGYADEAAYSHIVNNPESPFIKAAQANHLEDHARWISSDRGLTTM